MIWKKRAMDKKRNKFSEKARVIVANKINIPPDDVDMEAFLDCAERAIEKSCNKNDGEVIVTLESEREKEAVLGEHGQEILGMIFSNEYPFVNFKEDYEEWYVSKFLKSIYENRNIE